MYPTIEIRARICLRLGWCPTVGRYPWRSEYFLSEKRRNDISSFCSCPAGKDTHTQRFYRDHYDDLSGMCTNGVIIASGQVGHYPPIMLWDSGAGAWEGTSENAQLEFGPPHGRLKLLV